MEVKVIKEVTVDSNHFEFKVAGAGDITYQVVIPETNESGDATNYALVFWNHQDEFGTKWYSIDYIKNLINSGSWIVTNTLDEIL